MDNAVLIYGYYVVDVLNIFKHGFIYCNGKSNFLRFTFLLLHYYNGTYSVFTLPEHSFFLLLKYNPAHFPCVTHCNFTRALTEITKPIISCVILVLMLLFPCT